MILVMRSRATKLPETLIRIVGPVDRILSAATPRQIGDISYGIYLLHMLILLPIACWLTTQGWYSHQPPLARTLVLSVLAFIPAYLGSIATHILIERPLIVLGRGLIRRPVKLGTAR
jgi:peptidoglycan/LPS O-acetylase OafA/YrhL